MENNQISLGSLTDMMMDVNISLFGAVTSIFLTLLTTFLVRMVYIRFGGSMNNRAQFANSFLLLGMTTCVIIIVVKYSLALSLGLVGALSIVRFRAAIKDPEEITVLFLVIAIGLSFGANQYPIGILIAIVGSMVIAFSSVNLFGVTRSDDQGMVVVISGERNAIKDLYKNHILTLKNTFNFVSVKEYNLEDITGQIVLRISANNESSVALNDLEERSENLKLNFTLVSEIGVAN
jgi:hypothetical protein